jgi:precorrin-8X/cobalt-precorrin-8 methylmutase
MQYLKDPDSIYRQSFAAIRAEADLSSLQPETHVIAIRLMHASGMTDLARDLRIDPALPKTVRSALAQGNAIITDCEMVRVGLLARNLPKNVRLICTLNDPRARELGQARKTTRSAAAAMLWKPHLAGAVVVIGNAPTALFSLLELIDEGAPKPSAIIAMPVGFVGAAEAKAELAANPRGIAYATLLGRRGGSGMAAAALNAITAEAAQ